MGRPQTAQGQQGGQAGNNAQPTQQFPFGQPAQQTPQGQQGNRNPYYTNNPQPQGNGNPFNPPTQPQQNNGNPFASQSGQNGQNGSPSRAVCSVSAFPVPVRRTVKVRPSRDSPASPVSPAPPSRACPRRRATFSSPWSPPFWLRPSAWASVTVPSPAA